MKLLAMWAASGFDPDSFWEQSPATFQAVMEGVRTRLERDFETQVSLAWHTAAFTGATQSRQGLKPLRHYLGATRKQSPTEMVGILRSLGTGSDMKITRIKREG